MKPFYAIVYIIFIIGIAALILVYGVSHFADLSLKYQYIL